LPGYKGELCIRKEPKRKVKKKKKKKKSETGRRLNEIPRKAAEEGDDSPGARGRGSNDNKEGGLLRLKTEESSAWVKKGGPGKSGTGGRNGATGAKE